MVSKDVVLNLGIQNQPLVGYKIIVLKNLEKLTGKRLCWSRSFNKKKETPTQVLFVNFLGHLHMTASNCE